MKWKNVLEEMPKKNTWVNVSTPFCRWKFEPAYFNGLKWVSTQKEVIRNVCFWTDEILIPPDYDSEISEKHDLLIIKNHIVDEHFVNFIAKHFNVFDEDNKCASFSIDGNRFDSKEFIEHYKKFYQNK